MSEQLKEQLDGLLEKYTELLLGETSETLKEDVKHWIIYQHVAKMMPALAKHWNATYPDAKANIKEVILEIKKKNEAHRKQ